MWRCGNVEMWGWKESTRVLGHLGVRVFGCSGVRVKNRLETRNSKRSSLPLSFIFSCISFKEWMME
jgi:hypothetical protein